MSQLPAARDVSAVELLDRLLEKGVVLSGDVTISVAGVDLIYLGLRVLLSSAETAERFGAPVPSSAALEGDALRSVATDSSPLDSDALDPDALTPRRTPPRDSGP